jgi:hypothetical protein
MNKKSTTFSERICEQYNQSWFAYGTEQLARSLETK